MFNLTKNEYDYYLRAADTLVKLGWVYVDGQWVAPEADPVGSVPVAKEPVTDEKGFALSLDKAFIRNATDKALDTITKHLAGVDWSALGNTNAAKAEDTLRYSHNGMFGHGKDGQLFINKDAIGNEGYLYAELARADDILRADIEALKERLDHNRDSVNWNVGVDERRYEKQQELNERQNQRINDLEDTVKSAFEPKSKGRLDVTTQLEAAILRGFRTGLLKELGPGGLLHRY